MKAPWVFRRAAGAPRPKPERLKKLARNLDALARKDDHVIRRTNEIGALRHHAAQELHEICGCFVVELNTLLVETALELDPREYRREHFQEEGINLFQINARGRILQIEFGCTPELSSTENFRVPYILEGAVRCFNQQALEKQVIEEQALFYTMEKARNLWRFFDPRTYRSGPFGPEYLTSLLEQLL